MIIDFKNDWDHARRHDVIDPLTGEELTEPIFYADDEAGVIRFYLKDGRGAYYRGDDGNAAWAERRGRFAIVPKPPEELRAIEEDERDLAEQRAEERRGKEWAEQFEREAP